MAWHDRIMVVGGAGFVGGELVRTLRKKFPASVIAVVDPCLSWIPGVANYDIGFAPAHYDVFRPTSIFNCACLGQEETEENEAAGLESNVGVVYSIVHTLLTRGSNIPFVHTGSASIYGPGHRVDPTTKYGKHKNLADQIALLYENTRILRLTNVFGPGMKLGSPYCGFVGKVLRAKLLGESVTITDPTAKRTYTRISDVCSSYIEVVGSDKYKGSVVNMYAGWDLSPVEVATAAGVSAEFAPKRKIDGVSRAIGLYSDVTAVDKPEEFKDAFDAYYRWETSTK